MLIWFKEFIEEDSYKVIKILNKKIKFFTPNKLTELRIKNFFNSEPETLSWINNFEKEKKLIFWDIGANIGLYSVYAALKHSNIEITSFGGVDISAFPGVYSLVDITIKWLLRQYTFPSYRNINIQETFFYNSTCEHDNNNSKYSNNKYNIISIFHKIILVIFSNNDNIKINTFDDFM